MKLKKDVFFYLIAILVFISVLSCCGSGDNILKGTWEDENGMTIKFTGKRYSWKNSNGVTISKGKYFFRSEFMIVLEGSDGSTIFAAYSKNKNTVMLEQYEFSRKK